MTIDGSQETSPSGKTTSGSLPQVPDDWARRFGEKLFEIRDYTPIPLIILVLFTAEPGVTSATFGTLLVVFGELFRIYSVSFIGSSSRTRNTETTGAQLVTEGPFSWIRNPLYFGNFWIVAGIALFAGVLWVFLLTVLLFGFQYYCIVKYEESKLRERFGTDFERYTETVPAWVPSRVPPLEEWQWPETFTPALKSEQRTLAAIGLMLGALLLLA